ncbi:YhcB family protein [Rheinheimera muenzenbergensis]|uniref:Z-ring associated protein G n=1 Tax=Rheinheimera muenzenbergensis TaxID=1193628 RepID=A0ABU8CBF8_9GAMM|nr:YhcB family protein [Gammaproteobacteria bacterium]MBU1555251.1 YhcB family protein [Gammaproteobacteria bacterium]MBU2068917.1 YhcB family protein [Gammaproteobacteria bacterium]MBU2181423.1 YhcB family protein [Gammaproteobacteria bacterium]MBU2203830.1 YhcB family protein [Gammaproteobacteria bacterium]
MEYLYIVMWLVIGLVVGAVSARLLTLKQLNRNKLKLELENSQAQLAKYRHDVSTHLETTNQLMTQLQDNYARIARHIADSRMQLVEQPTESVKQDLNYLSGDTAAYIRQSLHQIDEKRRVYSEAEAEKQPLDYSGQASGLIKEYRHSKADK